MVLVVRPQPGQAVTLGAKERRPATAAARRRRTLLRGDRRRARRERNADRIANAFAEQNAHGRGGPDQSFRAHACFGKPEMQRLVGLARQLAVNIYQIARPGNFAGNNNLILAQAAFDGEGG